MNDVERLLGRLEEFKEQTLRELQEIKDDIRALQKFKWRVVGGAAVLSFILTGLIELLQIYLKKEGL